jgi:hypothetical protein
MSILNQRLDQLGSHQFRAIYGQLYRALSVLGAAAEQNPPCITASQMDLIISCINGGLESAIAAKNAKAMQYGTADLSTFEKLEGVGKEAYWKWQEARWEKQAETMSFSERMNQEPEICRLEPIIAEIENRARVKPLLCIDPDNGDVYLHPELARELEKPINEGLRFELGDMGRNGAAAREGAR